MGEHWDTPHRYYQEKVAIIQIDSSRRKVTEGKRNAFLYRNVVRVMFLNQWLSLEGLRSIASDINGRCSPPLGATEVSELVSKIFLKRPPAIPNVLRRLLHNPRIVKDSKTKQSEAQSILSAKRGEATDQRIYDYIETYEGKGKLTSKKIAEGTGIPLSTVWKHGRKFREMIDHINGRGDGLSQSASTMSIVSFNSVEVDHNREDESLIHAGSNATPLTSDSEFDREASHYSSEVEMTWDPWQANESEQRA